MSFSLHDFLETSYSRFNRSDYIYPDPLLVPRGFESARDREIAALVAALLAVGRAPLILQAAQDIIRRMDGSPRDFLEVSNEQTLRSVFAGFRYRFFSGDDIASLLTGVRVLTGTGASLGDVFSSFVHPGDETVLDALSLFVAELKSASPVFAKNLFPSPEAGSACKRPLLFLRWMIRCDAVDPGGWDPALVPLLVQPMDTHMTWVAGRFGFIPCGKTPDLKTALQVTRCFREIQPSDPVKYDFALTRPGIRNDLDRTEWFQSCPRPGNEEGKENAVD